MTKVVMQRAEKCPGKCIKKRTGIKKKLTTDLVFTKYTTSTLLPAIFLAQILFLQNII
jgi:hypothetical protein